ncbi:MAG TPA: M81 family metallopeptidase [Burkholderiaceae bacterium]|nr:M81 family metallopeptidase [Burkholderiaceae bacterium]
MARIAVGGMQHETNTFAPSKADYTAFEHGGGWPPIQRGDALFDAVAGANIPVQGAIEKLRAANHRLVPLTWASASPSAHVTRDAFERIVGDLVARLQAAGPVDGVYLDLHGAMVSEEFDDGEGEILRRVRDVVGPQVPVVASLDLHANVTRAMVALADGLAVYRSYPHVDMAATGARAAALLDRMISSGQRPAKAFHQFDYLTGIPSQCTFIEPGRSLYQLLERIEAQHSALLEFAPGFPMADIAECGMSALAYATDAAAARAALQPLIDAIAAAEPQFAMELLSPDEAVERAIRGGAPGSPVVLADTQDNPGAGGNGDTTELLAALIRHRARDSVLGMLIDPASAQRAFEAGQGGAAEFSLGATSGLPGHRPVAGRFVVERLGDGKFTCTGPMFNNFRMNLGPMALLRESDSGVRVVLASRKCQAADQQMFRHVGIEPVRQRVVALKSSVHFRADFQPIAREVLVVRAPGPALADPSQFRWTKLRKGVRLRPLGPVHAYGRSA